MENNQEIMIQPQEFGIDENRGLEIVNKFSPLQVEITAYNQQYETILSSEINEDVTKEARILRLKLKDIRTKQVNKIHKSEKDFFLQGGRFVDAWKNRLNTILEIQEEKLQQVEDYFTNLEKQKIEDLRNSRWITLQSYIDTEPNDLGLMPEEMFNALLNGYIVAKKEKEEAEKQAEIERLENERINKLHNLRKEQALPLFEFWTDEEKSINFGTMSTEDYNSFFNRINNQKIQFDKEQEEIRKENEKLKLEAEKREKEAEIEAEKFEAERKEKERIEAELKAEKERERLRLEIEQKEKEAEEKTRLLAEEKAKSEELERKKAPIKKQLSIWVDEFSIPEIEIENETTKEIKVKFESFQKWAKSQIENI